MTPYHCIQSRGRGIQRQGRAALGHSLAFSHILYILLSMCVELYMFARVCTRLILHLYYMDIHDTLLSNETWNERGSSSNFAQWPSVMLGRNRMIVVTSGPRRIPELHSWTHMMGMHQTPDGLVSTLKQNCCGYSYTMSS